MEFNKNILQDRITNVLNTNFINEQERVELSKKINVTRNTIDRWRNQSLIPSIEYIANIAIILNKSIDTIVFEKDIIVDFSSLIFNEQKFKDRFSNILESQFKNSLQIAKLLNFSNSTIDLWKRQNTTPNFIKLCLFSTKTNISLDYILLGYK